MKLLIISLGLGLVAAPVAASAHDMDHDMKLAAASTAAPDPAKVSALKKTLEGLWIGHIDAVRKVVAAETGGNTAAAKAAEGEVVSNAHGIANAVAGFYGKAAGDKLFSLLAGHWGAIKAYLDATVSKNTAGQSAATSQLTSNADQIATFLSSANPYLPKATLSEMLLTHGSQHISQIQQLAAHDTAAEAKTAAAMRTHVIAIGDAMADAIAKQFPTKV